MNKTTAALMAVAAVCATVFACVALYFAGQANKQDTARMEACVSSGGEWVRDAPTAYYECRR